MNNKVNRPESAVQFEEIYEKHNNPEEREKRKILKNRQQKQENKKKDLGY